jgi:hypothetical protein
MTEEYDYIWPPVYCITYITLTFEVTAWMFEHDESERFGGYRAACID